MIPRPFLHKVPSLQLICASFFDTETLDRLNLRHLHLPPPDYRPPGPEIVFLNSEKCIVYAEDYNNFKTSYENMLTTKTLPAQIPLIFKIKEADFSEHYKSYLCSRVALQTIPVYVPTKGEYIVLYEADLVKVQTFLTNLKYFTEILNQITEIISKSPFVHKKIVREYVDKHKNAELKKYMDYFYIVLDRLCYENSLVTAYLMMNTVLPVTVSTLIYFLAPKQLDPVQLVLKLDTHFVQDPYLPCFCLKSDDFCVLRVRP